MKVHPCPKCGRRLQQSGELVAEGRTYPSFQCDECIVEAVMFGEPIELALTFWLDEAGRVQYPPAEI